MPKQAYFYLVLIFVGGAVSLWASAKLLKIEQSYSTELAKVKDKNEVLANDLANQRQTLRRRKQELAIKNLGWGRVWSSKVAVAGNQNPPQIQLTDLGSDGGLTMLTEMTSSGAAKGNPIPRIIYAFQPAGGNEFSYVGPFLVQNLGKNNATLVPTWKLLQNEASSWAGGVWRIREQIPSEAKVRFAGVVSRYHENMNTGRQTQQNLITQNKLLKSGEEQLRLRTGELLGDPDAPKNPRKPEQSEGLVPAIEAEEEARNEMAVEVDELRRAILEAEAEMKRQLSRIQESTAARPSGVPRLGSKPE